MIRLYNFSTAVLSQLFTLGMLLNWFTVCIKLHNPFGADTGYDIALPSELEQRCLYYLGGGRATEEADQDNQEEEDDRAEDGQDDGEVWGRGGARLDWEGGGDVEVR